MTTKQAQHLEPGDRVQTLLGQHTVQYIKPIDSSGLIEYGMLHTGGNQMIIRRSMPEWKVEIV